MVYLLALCLAEFLFKKPDAFYSNRFLRHKQVCKMHVAVWSIFNEKTRDGAGKVCKLSLGHVGHVISSTVSVLMGTVIFWTVVMPLNWSRTRHRLILGKWNRTRWPEAPSPLLSTEQARYTDAPGKKAGVTSFPGHNLDCRTQTGPTEEGERDKDWDNYRVSCSVL